MNVVYLFCETTVIRIPFFDYDKRLFNLLAAQGGGVWNNVQQEFVFKRNAESDALCLKQFSRIFAVVPAVWVEENAPAPLQIFGFWERAWETTTREQPTQTVQANHSHFHGEKQRIVDCKLSTKKPAKKPNDDEMPNLPERFSDQWEARLDVEMRARRFSPHTRSVYIYYNRLLCRQLQKTPEIMEAFDITTFLASMERTGEYSAATMNLAISAIKFFYKKVKKNDICNEHNRPRQDKRLPSVLSKGEVAALFKMEKNLKHRLLMMIVYAAGLRVSEAVCLRRKDLDMSRKKLTVVSGKGRKDRQTLLAQGVMDILCDYYTQFKISDDING